MNKRSRRKVIKTSGRGLAAVGLAGLAGCTSRLPLVGTDDEEPAIDQWLVDLEPADVVRDSDELQGQEVRERGFRYQVPSVAFDNETRLSYDDLWGRLVRNAFGVPAMDVDWQLTQDADWRLDLLEVDTGADTEQTVQPDIDVLAGSFDPDEIESNLQRETGTDPDPHGTSHGFETYGIGSVAYALRDDYLVRARGDGWADSIAVLEDALGARWGGDAERRLTDDADAGTLIDHRGSGEFVDAAVFPPRDPTGTSLPERAWQPGLVGEVRSLAVDGATTDVTDACCYESESEADPEALRDYVDGNRDVADDAFPTLEEYSIERSGRVLVVTGTARTKAIV